jgi:hypothetical protein
MRKTIRLKLTTAEDFERHFRVDSPGFYIAKEALANDEVSTALEMLEVVILTNKLFQHEFQKRMVAALSAYNKAKEYMEGIGTPRAADIALETLGKERIERILEQTAAIVKKESKVGMGVNDK